jgi:hypothetical protein
MTLCRECQCSAGVSTIHIATLTNLHFPPCLRRVPTSQVLGAMAAAPTQPPPPTTLPTQPLGAAPAAAPSMARPAAAPGTAAPTPPQASGQGGGLLGAAAGTSAAAGAEPARGPAQPEVLAPGLQNRLSMYTFSSRLELYVAEELWERLDR